METKRVKMLLKGKVQGVLFRDFAKQNAGKLGLVGYAKNLKNGDLELLVQGAAAKVDQFVLLCKKGPMFAKVEGADVNNEDIEDPDEYEFFDIRFS